MNWIEDRIKSELKKHRVSMGEDEAIKVASYKIWGDIKHLYFDSKDEYEFLDRLSKGFRNFKTQTPKNQKLIVKIMKDKL